MKRVRWSARSDALASSSDATWQQDAHREFAETPSMASADIDRVGIDFNAPKLQTHLDNMRDDPGGYDALDFGLVAMDLDGTVLAYNRCEAKFAGVSADRAIGLVFFTDIAPCTNNYLVSGRFEEESLLDESIDYTFTVKMRPTPVRLRLLKDERAERQYLAVKWQ